MATKALKPYPLYKLPKKQKKGKRREGQPDIPSTEAPSRIDPQEQEFAKRLGGDRKLARRVLALMREYPNGTLPELVTLDWLQREQVDFVYQAAVMGGRRVRGGMLPDFVIRRGGHGLAWLIQGEYFHSAGFQRKHGQIGRDMTARVRMLGHMVQGVKIEHVIELWENDIYVRRPDVFVMAMQGLGMRG